MPNLRDHLSGPWRETATTSESLEASKAIHFHFHSILSINFKFISNYGKNILIIVFRSEIAMKGKGGEYILGSPFYGHF